MRPKLGRKLQTTTKDSITDILWTFRQKTADILWTFCAQAHLSEEAILVELVHRVLECRQHAALDVEHSFILAVLRAHAVDLTVLKRESQGARLQLGGKLAAARRCGIIFKQRDITQLQI